MLFLLFGWGTHVKDLGPGAIRTCARCHNSMPARRLRTAQQLTVFFLPVLRWHRRAVDVCPICGHVYAEEQGPTPRHAEERPLQSV